MISREGWERGEAGPKVIKGKTYRNLVEFKRNCANCKQPFSIFVTERIASGHADSNSFGLRNCEQHRRAGSTTNAEVDSLKMQISTMQQELDPLYANVKALFEENQVLKARLATYELSAATFEQHAVDFFAAKPVGCEPVQNTAASMAEQKPVFPWGN